MSEVATELRRIRRELAWVNRRLALSRLPGKVLEVKEEKNDWRVRLDLGEDPSTGEKVESPFVRVQPASAGALKIKVKPTVGEQMYLNSASGIVGADSVAMWGTFDDDHPAPEGGEDVVVERGKTRFSITEDAYEAVQDNVRLRLSGGKALIVVDGAEFEVSGGEIRSKAGKIIADGEVKLGDRDPPLHVMREDGRAAEKVYAK